MFWSTVCAQAPCNVLIIGLIVTLCLSSGIYFLNIATTPMELWAVNASRSNMEKDTFERNFSPLYRTENLIIKAVGVAKVWFKIYNRRSNINLLSFRFRSSCLMERKFYWDPCLIQYFSKEFWDFKISSQQSYSHQFKGTNLFPLMIFAISRWTINVWYKVH